jgi:hypothetical protein
MGFPAASHRHRSFAARLLLFPILLVSLLAVVVGQNNITRPRRAPDSGQPSQPSRPSRTLQTSPLDRNVALRFAPVFQQGLGDTPGIDYITNFDFDGDLKGDNNWNNAVDPRFPHLAWVYYSVCETKTHWFIHYAAFHPRDYKGGVKRGVVLSDILREAAKYGGKYDPTGISDDAVLAHENDLEGCLVVVEKSRGNDPLGDARVVAVETLAHNRFLKYRPADIPGPGEAVRMEGSHPVLFVEPRGHGIEAFRDTPAQLKNSAKGVLKYEYAGIAEDPAQRRGMTVGYDLEPISKMLWKAAQGGIGVTYGEVFDYGEREISVAGQKTPRKVRFGKLGSAFLGKIGGQNMARPPWGWFDSQERERPLGEWFLDPAATIKRHYNMGEGFSVAYIHHPLAGVTRSEGR